MEKLAVAYHEAGHVVAAYHIGTGVLSSSIVANKALGSLGHTDLSPLLKDCYDYRVAIRSWAQKCDSWERGQEKAREEVMNEAMLLMAGPAAQKLFAGDCPYEVWNGDANRTLVRCLESSSKHTEALLEEAAERAKSLLQCKWPLVKAVASALREHERLNSEQLAKIMQQGKCDA